MIERYREIDRERVRWYEHDFERKDAQFGWNVVWKEVLAIDWNVIYNQTGVLTWERSRNVC
ncbi:MAG: hypothetical protein ACTS4U_00350 [Candidatus Hodgkinia cicadicola]